MKDEEEEEAVFIRGRRRRWSLLVKIEGDPLKTQHAQHRPRPEETGNAFTRDDGRRRRRRRLSLFVIVTNEDPPNAHQAESLISRNENH